MAESMADRAAVDSSMEISELAAWEAVSFVASAKSRMDRAFLAVTWVCPSRTVVNASTLPFS